MIPILQPPAQRWECPNCTVTSVTYGQDNRFHRCAGLGGLTVAMVRSGLHCKVEAVVREDFVGAEDVTYDAAGRPITAVVTTRDDGNDVTVYAPTAHMEGNGS